MNPPAIEAQSIMAASTFVGGAAGTSAHRVSADLTAEQGFGCLLRLACARVSAAFLKVRIGRGSSLLGGGRAAFESSSPNGDRRCDGGRPGDGEVVSSGPEERLRQGGRLAG